MRAFLALTFATLLSIGIGLAAAAATGRTASGAATPTGPIVLYGNGIGTARFGQAQAIAITNLDRVLGSPKTIAPVPYSLACGVDAFMQWPTMYALFYHQQFVGYGTRFNAGGNPTQVVAATTQNGLRLGESAARARRQYGFKFLESGVNGGVWSLATRAGLFRGYLDEDPRSTHRNPQIEASTYGTIGTIEAGHLGCPAMAPGGY